MNDKNEGYYEADTIGYFINKLYDGWKDCVECQYSQYICANHMHLILPLLEHEARKRGEGVKGLNYDDEVEWIRDIDLGGEG